MFDYPVTPTADDNGTVLMTFTDVSEAITFGADEDEALLNAIDALETGLSLYVDERKPLPSASKPDLKPQPMCWANTFTSKSPDLKTQNALPCPASSHTGSLRTEQMRTELFLLSVKTARKLHPPYA